MCLQFSFQGRAKVSLKNNCEKNRDFYKTLGYLGFLETFGDI